MPSIRPAQFNDVCGISMVAAEVWGQAIDTHTCLQQIRHDDCAIWVAVDDRVVTGFVSAFLTVGLRGYRRWEVDLLAVRSAWRGHQLGQKLVEATWAEAQGHQVNSARAVIQGDSLFREASQKFHPTTHFRLLILGTYILVFILT